MKKISIFFLALTVAVALFATSCSKKISKEPSAESSLAESSQVSEEYSTQAEESSESADNVSLDDYITLPYIPFE